MDKIAENKAFQEYWNTKGFKYKPQTDEEGDWLNVVKYWAWKAWEARATKDLDLWEWDEKVWGDRPAKED